MKECINCGYLSDSRYCPNCGQKLEVKRVSLTGIINEFLSKWIGFDTQFGRTLIGMTVKPGHVINSYLKGNRTKYIGPLGFLVIMTALLVVSFDLFGLEVQDFIEENQSNIQEIYEQEVSEQQSELQKKITEFVAKNFRFFATILIPFWGVALWFFYKKAGHNYIERLVIAIYLTCHGIWITILGLGLFAFSGRLFSIPMTMLSIFYYSYGLMNVYKRDNYFVSLLKVIGSYVVSIVLMLVSMLIVGLILGMIAAMTNSKIF